MEGVTSRDPVENAKEVVEVAAAVDVARTVRTPSGGAQGATPRV